MKRVRGLRGVIESDDQPTALNAVVASLDRFGQLSVDFARD
jgi:hypothetical protein